MSEEQRRGELEIPDRRIHTYAKLEGHVDEKLTQIEENVDEHLNARITAVENRFSRWFKLGLVAFAFIALTTTAALVGYGVLLKELRDTRVTFVKDTCESQNTRHDTTRNALIVASDRDIENAKKGNLTSQGRVSVQEIENRRDVTLGLIDLLAPKQNCDFLAKIATGDAKPTPVATPKIPPKPTPTKTP